MRVKTILSSNAFGQACLYIYVYKGWKYFGFWVQVHRIDINDRDPNNSFYYARRMVKCIEDSDKLIKIGE